MANPNFDYRPVFERSLFLSGEVGESTLSQLTPDIIRLQNVSREPICLYIDSLGGSTYHADSIYDLLKAATQDSPPCRLITIVTTKAMSAAADLLSAGDYALAYPGSRILHHGTRRFNPEALTRESAIDVADSLKRSNDRYASRLADRCMERFVFRYVFLQTPSKGRRESPETPAHELLTRFINILGERVSTEAHQILAEGLRKYGHASRIAGHVLQAIQGTTTTQTRVAEDEAQILKSIIDFELADNEDLSWSFQYGGLAQLQEDFLLLTSYFIGEMNKPLLTYINRWSYYLLSSAEKEEWKTLDLEKQQEYFLEKTGDLFRELWLFLTALCRSLQEGEFILGAEDCFWLGFIDEVIGRADLPSLRLIMED